jgi:hypothetical protein
VFLTVDYGGELSVGAHQGAQNSAGAFWWRARPTHGRAVCGRLRRQRRPWVDAPWWGRARLGVSYGLCGLELERRLAGLVAGRGSRVRAVRL